ncbi:PPE domain-containing protein [Mycobacterium leprae]|uniref:PPE domain-containing protein n=1 Tax=Mycobacterium leprae TaxID=1769 RepID=A0AAD0KQJ9_MYCLR|nr:PPE domain-containing protein [Mycobacterium leprae]OAR21208.1 hypothetical protein A8144_07515 [Mycobacterium leprae 3125609]OAX71086.1 hypothetical protein A3216_07865 [Mycobacterium leprae 7935681]
MNEIDRATSSFASTSHAEQAASQVAAVVGAFESALAATTQPPLVTTNRALLSFLAHSKYLRAKRPDADGHRVRVRKDVGPGCEHNALLPHRRLSGLVEAVTTELILMQ